MAAFMAGVRFEKGRKGMSYFTLKNGEKLYYEDTGVGEETVVMLHGWTSSHEVFAPCVPAISRKARCRGAGDEAGSVVAV